MNVLSDGPQKDTSVPLVIDGKDTYADDQFDVKLNPEMARPSTNAIAQAWVWAVTPSMPQGGHLHPGELQALPLEKTYSSKLRASWMIGLWS